MVSFYAFPVISIDTVLFKKGTLIKRAGVRTLIRPCGLDRLEDKVLDNITVYDILCILERCVNGGSIVRTLTAMMSTTWRHATQNATPTPRMTVSSFHRTLRYSFVTVIVTIRKQ